MTDQERKALQMALEVLENNRLRKDEHLIPIVVNDLRQALAQPEQEPVAWMTYKGYLYHASDPKVLEHSDPTPLYAAPPSKPWVSLTSEELASIVVKHAGYPTRQLAAIEAALKEKNT